MCSANGNFRFLAGKVNLSVSSSFMYRTWLVNANAVTFLHRSFLSIYTFPDFDETTNNLRVLSLCTLLMYINI